MGLGFQWYIIDFIEKQGVVVGLFEVIDLLVVGVGESVFFMVEQF